jgi:hypothetical protein
MYFSQSLCNRAYDPCYIQRISPQSLLSHQALSAHYYLAQPLELLSMPGGPDMRGAGGVERRYADLMYVDGPY